MAMDVTDVPIGRADATFLNDDDGDTGGVIDLLFEMEEEKRTGFVSYYFFPDGPRHPGLTDHITDPDEQMPVIWVDVHFEDGAVMVIDAEVTHSDDTPMVTRRWENT